MQEWLKSTGGQGNAFVIDHPKYTFAAVVVGLFLFVTLPNASDFNSSATSPLVTVLVIALSAASIASAWFFHRIVNRRPDDVAILSLVFAITPLFAAVSFLWIGAAVWLVGPTFLASVLTAGVVLVRARRSYVENL